MKFFSIESNAQLIADSLRAELSEDDDTYQFKIKYRDEDSLTVALAKDRLREITDSLRQQYDFDANSIYTDQEFETLVREKTMYGPPVVARHGEVEQEDRVNGLTYHLGPPSLEYVIFLLNRIAQEDEIGSILRNSYSRFFIRRQIENDAEDEVTLSDILKRIIPRFMTLTIKSEKDRSVSVFNKFADSALFQLSYNLDVAVVQSRSVEEIVRTGRIRRNRRNKIGDIEAPRRHFESDLIHHYQMGVAANNPSLEYLSYYHVCEYFYDSIFENDLVNDLQDLITQPDFSYRRKRDLQSVIKKVKDSFRSRGSDFAYDENYALKLTLRKFVDLDDLKAKVEDYDPLLVEHYKINEVDFAGAVSVNLENDDDMSELGTIATRIYRTRNAIVHSKEGSKDRYIPFKHDHILFKEVPLIRFVAETIIYETSSLVRQ